MESYTSFTTNKKGHLLIHPVLATIIILLVLILAVTYVLLKNTLDETPVKQGTHTPQIEAPKLIVEINFTKNQTAEEKKALLVNRLETISRQPLFLSEKQAILSEYGDTNKVNLTETEKQQIIKALNK